jgi:glutathione synthase
MNLTVAIQMDPIGKIDIAGDSTFALALEGQRRGHGLLYYGPRDLTFRDGKVFARVRPLHVRAVKGDHFALGEAFAYDLASADVVLMRQDPPFDMAYITATHFLERLHPKRWWLTIRPRCAMRRRNCSSPNSANSCRRR